MPLRPMLLAPSLLSADMAALGEAVHTCQVGGADWIHVDVMDGRFVPNITVGVPVVQALARRTQLPLDVHLMIVEPDTYLTAFAQAGARILTVQAEACWHLHRTLRAIRAAGCRAGVALNPATPLQAVEFVLEEADLVLVMTVEPGFGGQGFIPAMLPKIEQLRNWLERRQLAVDIQVDGGINSDTIFQAAQAGANVFVAGNSVFGGGGADIASALERLRKAVRPAADK